jgi:hypothetical protein
METSDHVPNCIDVTFTVGAKTLESAIPIVERLRHRVLKFAPIVSESLEEYEKFPDTYRGSFELGPPANGGEVFEAIVNDLEINKKGSKLSLAKYAWSQRQRNDSPIRELEGVTWVTVFFSGYEDDSTFLARMRSAGYQI